MDLVGVPVDRLGIGPKNGVDQTIRVDAGRLGGLLALLVVAGTSSLQGLFQERVVHSEGRALSVRLPMFIVKSIGTLVCMDLVHALDPQQPLYSRVAP